MYKVWKVDARVDPALIYLETLKGQKIERRFYQVELQKTVPPSDKRLYLVESILDTRQRNGKKEFLVRWQHYGSDYDTVSTKICYILAFCPKF